MGQEGGIFVVRPARRQSADVGIYFWNAGGGEGLGVFVIFGWSATTNNNNNNNNNK